MAVRQYIGARYMPSFLGEYNATQIYHVLDVVDNGTGTSYICVKQTTPGIPLTNREYWKVYGSASGAILDLQDRMGVVEDDLSTAQDDIEDLKIKTEERVFQVTGDGVKTYAQLLNELYEQAQEFVNSLEWEQKRRLLIDTPYGCWYVNAIGTSVLEFYGIGNVLDTQAQKLEWAIKLTTSTYGSHLFRMVTLYDSSTHEVTSNKIEGWSNTAAYVGQTFRLMLI